MGGNRVLLKDWIAAMERIAPPELALDFDNPGLLISPERKEIHKVLVALDCTAAVAREAADWGAELVLTHHPLFFRGVKHILDDDPETAAAWTLIRRGIGLYAAHTNLDAAQGGVNDALMAALGAREVRPLPPENLGRIGRLETPMTLRGFALLVERRLHARADIAGNPETKIATVACVGGSGAEDMAHAKAAGADVFLTGELKHHQGHYAETLGIALIAAGHAETERVALEPLIERLQRQTNDVQYKLALSDRGPFWRA